MLLSLFFRWLPSLGPFPARFKRAARTQPECKEGLPMLYLTKLVKNMTTIKNIPGTSLLAGLGAEGKLPDGHKLSGSKRQSSTL
ncbi:hypothetical protein Pnap_2292 [Polaromonas naphthalenivorans CJ2]|uniref:Uncharacterized protein n=1 Tax=Polaromonas naphthalenivorans (strain CJ2) TaxID=365044 RepID=A1VPM2_POLNA|nr:hypothetical protein Pnap_2292 [Polaromonas naphthalenivorans CJ2]